MNEHNKLTPASTLQVSYTPVDSGKGSHLKSPARNSVVETVCGANTFEYGTLNCVEMPPESNIIEPVRPYDEGTPPVEE